MHLTKTKTLFTIVVALSVSPVFAGLHSWTSSGPAGGNITTMAADPANPATLYVGTHGAGIYKTEDNGRTWSVVNQGLPELVIFSFTNGPDPATWFAATVNGKLARTEDGGAHWIGVGNAPAWSEVIFDQEQGVLYVISGRQILRSADLGNTWQVIPQSHVFFKVTVSRGQLFAIEYPDLFVSNDGVTWTPLTFDPFPNPTRIIAGQDGSIFVFGDQNRIARSLDGGKHWTELAPVPATYVDMLSAYSGGVVVATPEGVLRYDDDTKAWASIGRAQSGSILVRTSAEGESIFVFDFSGHRLHRWTTAQNDWQVVNLDLRIARTREVAVGANTVYAATDEGLARLVDRAKEWEFVYVSPSPYKYTYAVEATDSREVLVGSFDGFHKSVNGGATWSSIKLGDGLVSAVAGAPSERRNIYAAAYDRMMKSLDSGATWSSIQSNMPQIYGYFYYGFSASDVKVDPEKPETVYVCAGPAYKSIDGGAKWDAISHVRIKQIAIDWSNPAVLYAAPLDVDASGVWRSNDAGATWQQLDLSEQVSAIAIDPNNASFLYAGTPTGKVYRSADSGNHWQEMTGGLSGAFITRIAVDAARHRIYAATDGGVFEYVDSPDGGSTYAARFTTYYGNFVSAAGCGGGPVNANATAPGPCEKFTLIDRDGGALLDGDRINIKAPSGEFVVAENGGASGCGGCASPVNANRSVAGPWELFTIHKIGGSDPRISAGDHISLQSIAGDYIAAEWGGRNGCACDAVLNANRAAAREWETFTIRFP